MARKKDNEKNIIETAVRVRKKKSNHHNSKRYYLWGNWYTVKEVAEKLNLSRQYCHLRLKGGYEKYLENYNRDTIQIKTIEETRRKKREEPAKKSKSKKKKEEEETFSFLEAIETIEGLDQ